jgi:Dyp-type peroxidase family
MTTQAPVEALDLEDIQGFIMRTYPLPCARYVYVHINNSNAARNTLEKLTNDHITSSSVWQDDKQGNANGIKQALNIAITFKGLMALGLPASSLISFPTAFAEGMAKRKILLGDEGDSDPGKWDKVWLDNNTDSKKAIHLWLAIFTADESIRDSYYDQLAKLMKGASGLTVLGFEDAGLFKDPKTSQYLNIEHFGYRDGISDIEFKGMPFQHVDGRGKLKPDGSWEPLATGEFLLGYPDESPEWPIAPMPHTLARNGTFMAVRKLHQNVASFRKYLEEQSQKFPGGKELLAAKFVGRWRDGTPLTLSPDKEDPVLTNDGSRNNNFSYKNDMDGHRCPMGAHIRRMNPRDAMVFSKLADRRRILRRGFPYGTYTPEGQPVDDAGEHGTMFLALNSSLERQFEFVQQQWVHYGNDFFQGDDKDPLLGNNDGKGKMVIQGDSETNRPPRICTSLPSFVNTRGGDYFFIPSLTALRQIAMGIVSTI